MSPEIRILSICALLALCHLTTAYSSVWERHLILDPENKYHLHWKVDQDFITFKVEVQTTGYVGFGISPNGGMKGSDIVIGWVKNGVATFHDRHATGNRMPIIDDHQDWFLLEGSENATHTTLMFYRKLNTCDEQDRPITDGTTRLIFSWNDKDPESADKVSYHGSTNRGTKSYLLLNPSTPDLDTSKMGVWKLRAPNTSVPDYDSTYWCTFHKAPKLPGKRHIVKLEPHIQVGHERLVHHALLYDCLGVNANDMEELIKTPGYDCSRQSSPPQAHQCQSVFYVYAIGGGAYILPEHIALPIGEQEDRYFMLEMHYDNPGRVAGYVDASGMNFYYTDKLRKYDAGVIMTGATVSQQYIPPKQEEFIVNGHCTPECTSKAIKPEGLNLVAVGLHSHLLGRKMVARHFRGKTELPYLAKDDFYDFNYQQYIEFQEEKHILPGDQITTECYYNSMERNETTSGGIKTRDEMCLSFFYYYPKQSISVCLTHPPITAYAGATGVELSGRQIVSPPFIKQKSFNDYITSYEWLDEKYVKALEYITRYGPQMTVCLNSNGPPFQISSHGGYPKNFIPYKEPDVCKDK